MTPVFRQKSSAFLSGFGKRRGSTSFPIFHCRIQDSTFLLKRQACSAIFQNVFALSQQELADTDDQPGKYDGYRRYQFNQDI